MRARFIALTATIICFSTNAHAACAWMASDPDLVEKPALAENPAPGTAASTISPWDTEEATESDRSNSCVVGISEGIESAHLALDRGIVEPAPMDLLRAELSSEHAAEAPAPPSTSYARIPLGENFAAFLSVTSLSTGFEDPENSILETSAVRIDLGEFGSLPQGQADRLRAAVYHSQLGSKLVPLPSTGVADFTSPHAETSTGALVTLGLGIAGLAFMAFAKTFSRTRKSMHARQLGAPERRRLIAEWIGFHRVSEAPSQRHARRWAVYRVDQLVREEPESAWQLILEMVASDLDARIFSILAADPLSTLLSFHGRSLILRFEREAAANPRLKELLRGASRLSISEDVWARVQAASAPTQLSLNRRPTPPPRAQPTATASLIPLGKAI